MLKSSHKHHLYTELAELPSPTSASFHDESDGHVVDVSFTHKIHDRDAITTSSKTFIITSSAVASSKPVQVASDIKASTISPSGARRAILRQSPESTPRRFVEIWVGDRLEISKEVTDIHGVFCMEGELKTHSFSPSEDTFLYSAEAKDSVTDETAGIVIDQFERFRYRPTFGEGFSGKRHPTLHVLRWDTAINGLQQASATLMTLSAPSGHLVLFGQAVLTADNRVFAIGYEYMESGRLLGLLGCFNRPQAIWEMRFPDFVDGVASQKLSVISKLGGEGRSARCPQLSPDGLAIIWISNPVGGAHSSCTTLHSMDLVSRKKRTLVDTVWEPSSIGGFPGLYEPVITSKSFALLGGTNHLVTSTYWGSRTTIVLVSMDDGEVRELTPADSSLLSWDFLTADGNHQIVCVRSSCTVPREVVLGNIGDDLTVSWQVLSKPKLTSAVQEQLTHLEASIIPIPDRHPVEIVLLRSKSAPASAPCICWPHGGPHSIHTTEFTAACVAFAVAGYTCSLVNYTGTPGFGETYIQKLLGRCGTLDVEDSFASANHLVDIGVSELGRGKQFVYGISHGGFLAAHLIGQFPDMFSAAGIRNPVISCGEFSITDIPDWYFFEFGLPYNSRTIMTPETYAALFTASPIAHVDKVQAKVLLHLGAVDTRVAPTHAIMYYHALKGRGKTVEMLAFPKDSHSLGGVETARMCWESARDWFDLARE